VRACVRAALSACCTERVRAAQAAVPTQRKTILNLDLMTWPGVRE